MTKRFLAAMLPLVMLAALLTLGAGKGGKAAKKVEKKPPPVLQNVEVLDPYMTLRDARRSMAQFNRALGVTCRDCHVLVDFSSDEKALKVAAREMMKMQAELNEKWFAGAEVVTCWTCHRGSRVPETALTLSAATVDSVREAASRSK